MCILAMYLAGVALSQDIIYYFCRWATSSWSECSASFGTGFQLRQVACQQLMADGSVKVLALNYCGLTNRPAARKPCVTDACVDWVPQPWGQVKVNEIDLC